MAKKKKNQHPQNNAKTKNVNSTHEEYDRPRKTFGSSVQHAASSGWVQNITVAFLGSTVWVGVAMIISKDIRAAAITFAATGTIALWILAVVLIRFADKELPDSGFAFSPLLEFVDGSHDPNRGIFFVRYPSGYGDTLSPCSVAMYLTVKSLNSTPTYVSKLDISLQKKGADWVSLIDIPGDAGRMYWVYGDLAKATLLDMSMLDTKLKASIPPGETIPGWVFLSVPREYPIVDGDQVRWRFQLEDSAGRSTEFATEYKPVNQNDPNPSTLRQSVPIKIVGTTDDLSHLFRRNYGPLP